MDDSRSVVFVRLVFIVCVYLTGLVKLDTLFYTVPGDNWGGVANAALGGSRAKCKFLNDAKCQTIYKVRSCTHRACLGGIFARYEKSWSRGVCGVSGEEIVRGER